MGKQRDPWFLEISLITRALRRLSRISLHHANGATEDKSLVLQAPHLALPQGLDLARVLNRVALA